MLSIAVNDELFNSWTMDVRNIAKLNRLELSVGVAGITIADMHTQNYKPFSALHCIKHIHTVILEQDHVSRLFELI